jgi:two-component system nitrogen regulation sensor histidine kinase GlnL
MTSHQPDTGRQMQLLNALPHAALLVDEGFNILEANNAAEVFFRTSLAIMRREGLNHFVPFGSPVFATIDQVVSDGAPLTAYGVDLSSPRQPDDMLVDVYAVPIVDAPEPMRTVTAVLSLRSR